MKYGKERWRSQGVKKTVKIKEGGRRRKKWNRSKLLVTLSILFVVYLGFAIFFQTHFFFGTMAESINCSMKSVDQVQELLSRESRTYELTIEGREGQKEHITAEEVDLTPVFDSSIGEQLKSQNGFLWPIAIFKKNIVDLPVDIQFSEQKLKKLTEQFGFYKDGVEKEPKNAYIGEYENGEFPVIQEEEGTLLNREKVYEKVKESISNLSRILVLEEAECYVKPEITKDSEEIKREQQELNKYLGAVITYEFGDEKVVVDSDEIHQWLVLSEEGEVNLDEEKVREYVNGLARTYDTFGSKREFRTSKGESLTMTEGDYGWWMNRLEETKELIEAIKTGETITKEPVYHAKAAQYGENDIGDTYVEIDLTNQHLYLYVHGALKLESDFVSGDIRKGYNTPTGVYGLTYKERDATLNGENYSSPVSYWMPFNGNVGMHDAKWRSSFGGEIYVRNGSHGCVNLPYEKAKEIYEHVEKGTPVIVYGGYSGPSKEEQDLIDQQKALEELMNQNPLGIPGIPGLPLIPQAPLTPEGTPNTPVPTIPPTPVPESVPDGVQTPEAPQ